jgi:enoyl-CoA hydratase/carnithine racemase
VTQRRLVRFDQQGALAIVALSNPPLNQIDQMVVDDLRDAIAKVEATPGLRALLLRGEGSVFSAGADVSLFAGMSAAQLRPLIGSFLDLGHRIEQLPYPTVAAVHGTCMAGGLELAEDTSMGLPETRLGIMPLAGGVERIAARAGTGRARAIAFGAGLHDAMTFLGWGIVDHVVAAEHLQQAALEFATRLAAGPTRAFGVTKGLLRAYRAGGVEAADAMLGVSAVDLFDSSDAAAGIHSYLTSGPGKAVFTGQ